MSPDNAIEVEDLGKQYQLVRSNASKALHKRLEQAFRHVLGIGEPPARVAPAQYLWALRHVSFQVGIGEIFGIIGGNGAGKSCLLRMLSRVTKPTEGRAFLRGRPGSILDLGTVVHPELTGRENIYQSANILGLERAYIDRNFEEIVEFSELSGFLDVPMKKYSTGMRARLAFALMTQLQTEMLFIDEALSVGDEQFREKCVARMRQLTSRGRTILVVSHSMTFIQGFCNRAMLLHKGRMVQVGPAEEISQMYRDVLSGRCAISAGD